MDYYHELVGALGREISEALRKNNEPIVNAINNLAMNMGNKTTREYNELKKKYTELENKCEKSDSLLKSVVTLHTFILFNRALGESLNSDRIVEIMDRAYDDIQKRRNNLIPDALYENMINIADEVYDKLMRR